MRVSNQMRLWIPLLVGLSLVGLAYKGANSADSNLKTTVQAPPQTAVKATPIPVDHKTAQLSLARGLGEMTAKGTNVTVNSVLAGPTRSEGVAGFLQELAKAQGSDSAAVEKEFFRSARPSSLLKRFATPEEVAAMVVYIRSHLASATNGAALRGDGGVARSIV